MDLGRVGLAGMAENVDAEPVKRAGVNAHEQEGVTAAPILAKGTVSIELTGETECHPRNPRRIGAQHIMRQGAGVNVHAEGGRECVHGEYGCGVATEAVEGGRRRVSGACKGGGRAACGRCACEDRGVYAGGDAHGLGFSEIQS